MTTETARAAPTSASMQTSARRAIGSGAQRASVRSALRGTLISAVTLLAAWTAPAFSAGLKVEKEQIKLGFIKLTDMVPLAIAYEKGFFEDEGLYVTLEPQANWKVVLDRVITGELDGSHMLSGQPFGATMGYGTKADMITVTSMAINGKGITLSNEVWGKMRPGVPKDASGKPIHPISSQYLLPVANDYKAQGKTLKMGIVFPVSSHNYELRYWLGAGGVNPGFYSPSDLSGQIKADILLNVVPPPQMPATMEAGTISGYCVGEPWNQQAIFKKVGTPVNTSDKIFSATPDKIFGVTKAWAEKNPNTLLAITKALIRASLWLDANNGANRKEAAQIISRPEYVGADYSVISASMLGTFEFDKGDKRPAPNFNVFSRGYASYPFTSDGVWTLSQMRRWGQIPEQKSDEWYVDMAKKVMRNDIYLKAAQMLVAEKKAKKEDFPFDSDGFRAPTADLVGGPMFDGHKANTYIDSFKIGLKGNQKVEGGEVVGK